MPTEPNILQTRLTPGLMTGLATAGSIFTLLGAALWAVFQQGERPPIAALISDSYLHEVLWFTLWQATLSVIFSIVPAILIARFLFYRRFPGRNLLLQLFNLCLVIPSIVAISGIVTIHGRQGLINSFLEFMGFSGGSYLYGLTGILLAHTFFNIPLATRLLLQTLEQIPAQQWRLSSQLGLSAWYRFKILEWPRLKARLPAVASLIFLLCFTSFAVILTLGGGPAATTLEVAIYQALHFDFDPGQAALLALLQLFICGTLLLSLPRQLKLQTAPPVLHSHQPLAPQRHLGQLCLDAALALVILVFIILPLAAAALAGINGHFVKMILSSSFHRALMDSLSIALPAAVLALALALALALGMLLLLGLRETMIRQPRPYLATFIETSGTLILMMPAMVLGTGLFILARQFADVFTIAPWLVIIVNTLAALPFVLKMLLPSTLELCQNYDRLCASLDLTRLNRFRLIEWPQLRRAAGQALGLAMVLSLGDFGVIALFGSQQFATLPLLLYRLLGSYRVQDAACVALLLILCCLILFWLCERIIGGKPMNSSKKQAP